MPNGRKGSLKRQIKTVGRIDSPEGVGLVTFYPDFLSLYPQLQQLQVIRQALPPDGRDSRRKYQLIFSPAVPPESEAEAEADSDSEAAGGAQAAAGGITTQSLGPYLLFQQLFKDDPLTAALQESFAQWELLLSTALFLLFSSAGVEELPFFVRDSRRPYDGGIADEDLARLLASLDDDNKSRSFFALYLRSPDVQEKLQQERLWLLDTTAERTYAESAASAAGQLSS